MGRSVFLYGERLFNSSIIAKDSGNLDKTPRYEYNQMLYRLDLDAPLQPAHVEK